MYDKGQTQPDRECHCNQMDKGQATQPDGGRGPCRRNMEQKEATQPGRGRGPINVLTREKQLNQIGMCPL